MSIAQTAKVVGVHVAVGAIAAIPVPGSIFLTVLALEKMAPLAGLKINQPSLERTYVISTLVGKAAAIAALATLLALGVITGPVGMGFAIAGISILGLCITLLLTLIISYSRQADASY